MYKKVIKKGSPCGAWGKKMGSPCGAWWKKHLVFVAALISVDSYAMNILMPYDTLIRPEFRFDKKFEFAFYAEHAFNAKGYNECGDRVNVLDIWNGDQDALAMLQGFPSTSTIGQLAIQLRGDGANDDGVRAHYSVCGDISFDDADLGFRYHFYDAWWFTFYLPVCSMKLTNVNWVNHTLDVSSGDQSVRENLTDNFFANVYTLGDGLELGGWHRTGLGDMIGMIEWVEDFWQMRPMLRKVRVNWRLGANFPTGVRKDEDKIFTQPFGFDGAFGIIFGFGMDVFLGDYFKLGGDVQLHHRFGNERCRRIKTDPSQTDLLLLQKSNAYIDFGLIQRFNLFVQTCNFKGMGCKFGYQFWKRGEDIISLKTPCFSTNIANTAPSLDEVTMHQGMVNVTYDCGYLLKPDAKCKPALELFAWVPFNGKHAAISTKVGAIVAFDF